ncbi:MAG: aldo/keto reductase [Planctomycetota bacterium]
MSVPLVDHPRFPRPVSRLGLGCGGPSRLGLRTHEDADRSRRLLSRAIDLGVTLIDTASTYGTEALVGEVCAALPQSVRGKLTICTKHPVVRERGVPIPPSEFADAIDRSLASLQTDRIDLFQLHGVTPAEYPHAINEILPVCLRAREGGKIDRLGITEAFVPDPEHRMLRCALEQGRFGRSGDGPPGTPASSSLDSTVFDSAMVGVNVLNQSACRDILPECERAGVAMLAMFAVRRVLTDEARLREALLCLHAAGELDHELVPDAASLESPLRWFASLGFGDATLPGFVASCYRWCRDTPGVTVVLSGTGNIEHLEANARAMAGPPLDETVRETLARVFARVTTETGN